MLFFKLVKEKIGSLILHMSNLPLKNHPNNWLVNYILLKITAETSQ